MISLRALPTWALYAITISVWGTTFFAITFQLGATPPEVSVAIRFVLAAGILLAACMLTRAPMRYMRLQHAWFAAQGFFTFSLSYVLTYLCEQHIPSGMVAVLFTLMIFWNAFGARLFFAAPLNPAMLLAAAMGVAGVAAMFWRDVISMNAFDSPAGRANALGLGLLATVSSSAGNMVATRNGKRGVPVLAGTTWAMVWGAAFISVYAACFAPAWHWDARPAYALSLLYLAVFGSVVAFTAYFTLLQRVGPAKSAYIGSITPVVSVLLSVAFEHYRVDSQQIAGMGLCFAGLWISIRARH